MAVILDSVMDEVADFVFTRSQENIVKEGSVDTGRMLTSANINRNFLEKEIVYPMPYSAYIEYGTDPHFMGRAGIEALTGWAKRKLSLSDKEAESAAWGIAKNIEKRGMPAKPFLRPAISELIARGVR